MDRLIRLAVCGVLFSVLVSVRPASAQDAAVIKELSRLEDVWGAAAQKKDGAGVGRLLAAGFLSMDDEDGTVVDKAKLVSAINTRKTEYLSVQNGNYQGKVFGNTAIIVGTSTIVAKTATGSETLRSAWTDTWIKQPDGQWLCVASQSARLPK